MNFFAHLFLSKKENGLTGRGSVDKEYGMKIGLDSYCYHSYFGEIYPQQEDPGKRMSFQDFVDEAFRLKVDGVSLETCFLRSLEDDEVQRMKESLDEAGLERVLSWGHPDGLEGGKNTRALSEMKRAVPAARNLGASVMRIVGSSYSFHDEPKVGQVERVSRMLKESMKICENEGVKLAIENHIDFTSDEILEILGRVDSDFLGVNLDTGNALRVGEDPVAATRKLVKYTLATHIKDVDATHGISPEEWHFFRSVPVGRGLVDVPAVVKVLKEGGYQGMLTVEMDFLKEGYGDEHIAVARSISYLKKTIRGL